jgi:GT2 family glycosyltransferase
MSRSDHFATTAAVENHHAARPRFSFIIVSYNTLALTRAAVASIVRHAANFSHEIILVDNHSTDNSVPNLRQEFPQLKIIAFEENRGFAAANNAGAKIAGGEWLILMNSDAKLFVDTTSSVDDLLCRHPEIDVLGGQLLNPDGSLQTSVILNHRAFRFEELHQKEELVEVHSIIGAFMVVRRELWLKLGGMDEGFFFYGEETDFCRRATNAGAVVRWSPRFRVLHHRGGSVKEGNLRATVEFRASVHHLWRKEMSEREYRFKVGVEVIRFFLHVAWYFSLSLLTGFLLRSSTGQLRKYAYLLNWHLRGCPAGWGLRPAALEKRPEKMIPEPQCLTHDHEAKSPSPLITVAICTRNRASFLEKAVRSVLPQMNETVELLIVDNASTDETPETGARLAAADSRVKIWREDELGLSAARNMVLKKACGQYVLFLDDDATAEPGWLAAYRDFLSVPPSEKIAVVGGPVYPDYKILPPKWINIQVIGHQLGGSPKRISHKDGPWGGNSAYRRDLALAAGMFDTRLGRKGEEMMSREESDLNLRLENAGYELWWLPAAAIRHFVPSSRVTFRATMRASFDEGQSAAIQRLKSRRQGLDRGFYWAGRTIAAPVQAFAHLLAMLFMLPWNRPKAIGHWFQVCRNCGFVFQLLR